MDQNELNFLESSYQTSFEKRLSGKRITIDHIEPIIKSLKYPFTVEKIGISENKKNIYGVSLGNGDKKILIWSQMHGNETTGTKALFDMFTFVNNSLSKGDEFIEILIKKLNILFIPIINPDGSDVFTKVNLNKIDLNRDAIALKAKESILLRNTLNIFQPKFCFNLHDQRSIFNVEGFKNPATLSFLAPSIDREKTLTLGRKESMAVIVAMREKLEKIIPHHIARYSDEFYPTATGDNFQKWGHNTILIESGHYPRDYNRNIVRKFNFYALLFGLQYLTFNDTYDNFQSYFDIPNNMENNFDVILRNIRADNDEILDIAFQYEYEWIDHQLVSKLVEQKRGNLSNYNGYNEF